MTETPITHKPDAIQIHIYEIYYLSSKNNLSLILKTLGKLNIFLDMTVVHSKF